MASPAGSSPENRAAPPRLQLPPGRAGSPAPPPFLQAPPARRSPSAAPRGMAPRRAQPPPIAGSAGGRKAGPLGANQKNAGRKARVFRPAPGLPSEVDRAAAHRL